MATKGITFTDTDTSTELFQLPGLVQRHQISPWDRQVVRLSAFGAAGYTVLRGKPVSRRIVLPVLAWSPWNTAALRDDAIEVIIGLEGRVGKVEVANYAGTVTHTFERCEFEAYQQIRLFYSASHGYVAECQMTFLQIGDS